MGPGNRVLDGRLGSPDALWEGEILRGKGTVLQSIANAVCVRWRCSLLSNYFDHLFYFYIFTSAGTSVYHETHALQHTALNQSYHFSGISGNLEMSGNFAQVGVDKSGKGQGICVVREICKVTRLVKR